MHNLEGAPPDARTVLPGAADDDQQGWEQDLGHLRAYACTCLLVDLPFAPCRPVPLSNTRFCIEKGPQDQDAESTMMLQKGLLSAA
jgi:hypothetical protein